ncbi:hypothetical protein BFR04_07925 [Gaetbulibacter sp. 4G1]|nr:hypothetical protein [Gaetbulibacter sp. 4G1]PIA78148.1 hypothetical protein BFR04_07925 [Gaetbulibacter sp. 4G1]
MRKLTIFLLIAIVCFAFTTDVQKRTVRENGFDVECYISLKKLKTYDADKIYYWFKSGGIHQSLGNVGGNVLHNLHLKYYRSNQLAEKGNFSYGLKTGAWKTWYKNGQLKVNQEWVYGYKNGDFKTYDSLGNLIIKGKYKNNLKDGYWIDFIKKDTTYHKNNFEFKERPKTLVERILRKKDSIEKVQIKLDRKTKRRNDSIKRVKLKLKRFNKKRSDSIKRVHNKAMKLKKKKTDSIEKSLGNKTKKGFFKRLFKKNK